MSIDDLALDIDKSELSGLINEADKLYLNYKCKTYSALLKESCAVLLDQNKNLRGFCNHPDAFVELNVGNSTPIYRRQYRIPLRLSSFVREQILSWQGEDIVFPVHGNYEWNNPLLVVPKKDVKGNIKGHRLCIDPRPINTLLASVNYPLPLIKDLLEQLSGAVVFTKLDLRLGFNQFQIPDKDRAITTFTFEGQQYQFRGVPFGFKHTPAVFQKVINQIIRKFKGFAFNYIDDIIIYSSSYAEHEKHVKLVMEELNKYNLRVNDKTEFGMTEMVVLGFKMSRNGLQMVKEKLLVMDHWQEPTTGNMIEKHLGFFNYFRELIPRYSEIVAPLEKLRKHAKVTWTDEYRNIYKKIRGILEGDLVLSYPNFNHEFQVATDASNHGVGAVLYQEYDGKTHYIAYGARALSGSEKNYGTTKRELLGIIFALEHFRYYLSGQHFKLFTDHKALTFMFTQKHTNQMLNNWLETLLSFDFEPIHRPGILNVLPDAISRFYDADPQPKSTNPVIWSMIDEEFIEVPVDWQLNPKIFEKVNQIWGKHDMDLFASSMNAQVPDFCDIKRDAFTMNWAHNKRGRLWMFPPIDKINDAIKKLEKDEGVATFVTPNDKSQPWYESLLTKSASEPLIVPLDPGVLIPHCPKAGKHFDKMFIPPGWGQVILWNVEGKRHNAVEPTLKIYGEYQDDQEIIQNLKSKVQKNSMEIIDQIIPEVGDETPFVEREAALFEAHAKGHNGAEGMCQILKNDGKNWGSMRHDAANYVKGCLPCQRYVIGRRGFHPMKSIHAALPWDHIGIDLKSFNVPSAEGNSYLLVVVDICTRFVFLRPIKDKTMETITSALFTLFCDVGFPKIIQSDRGAEFVNSLLQQLTEAGKIDHRLITAYHPQGNGVTERYVGVISDIIYKELKGKANDWERYVPATQLFVNARASKTTKSTPYSLMFARPLNGFDDYSEVSNELLDDDHLRRRLEYMTALVYPTISKASESFKNLEGERRNKKVKKSGKLFNPLQTGAIVMTVDELKSTKTQPTYEGPMKIIRRNRGGAYVLEGTDGTTYTRPPNALKVISRDVENENKELVREVEEPSYEVKKILAHRKNKDGTYAYRVEWKGYATRFNEWVEEEAFNGKEMIHKYWNPPKKRPRYSNTSSTTATSNKKRKTEAVNKSETKALSRVSKRRQQVAKEN